MINNDAWISEEIVLIDTWWNVNLYLPTLPQPLTAVLIDTWWNVNHERQEQVKCRLWVLIDTWWNVNLCITQMRQTNVWF